MTDSSKLMRLLVHWVFLLGLLGHLCAQKVEPCKGALILVSTEGLVHFLGASGGKLPNFKTGDLIHQSYTIHTGLNGKFVGLLSNGTLLTLDKATRMKVSKFEQEAFADDGRSVGELLTEPSRSEVELDLAFGSIVVKTKMLKKGSSFKINSPVGVAGIRGTEFQMASNFGEGLTLDVTESTVVFSPPKGGQEIKVNQGRGLNVSMVGVPTSRAVNPVAVGKIRSTNLVAVSAVKTKSVGELTAATKQATQNFEKIDGINAGADSKIIQEKMENSDPIKSENSSSGNKGILKEKSNAPEKTEKSKAPKNQNFKGKKLIRKVKEVMKSPTKEVDKGVILENNPELKKNQRLANFGLDGEDLKKYDRLSAYARGKILEEAPGTIRRLLKMPDFEGEKSEIFFRHDLETRNLLLSMTNEVMISLLDPLVDKVLLKESLRKINTGTTPRPDNIPSTLPEPSTSYQAIALGDLLKESGNSELMEELSEMAGGRLDEKWLRIGITAESLTRDRTVIDFANLSDFSADEAWGNPFVLELSNIYDQLELDALVMGADKVIGSGDLVVHPNAKALSSHFSANTSEVVLMSRGKMDIRADLSWDTPRAKGAKLVLMSGGDLTVKKGSVLHSETSDLVVVSGQNITVDSVVLDAAKETAIRGLRDVSLKQVTVGADVLATIKARRNLDVDGLIFKRDISRIVMEAQTMRLKNVNFPGVSQVRLNTLKGGIDGRYPNFGTVSASQQLGRVNFIQNVRSGGNLLNNRTNFDLHGKNIQIGKIVRP